MHFIVGANIGDSNTTGMGRQMHGLGEALREVGHRVDYLFTDSLGLRLGSRVARIEAPFRAVAALRRIVGKDRPAIAILHEPIAWQAALLLKGRVNTLAMVHACELRCWDVQLTTKHATGEKIALRSRILWPLTHLTQTYASLKLADGVLCLSSTDLTYISDRIGVPRSQIARIDNGLEARFLGLPFEDERRERDILFLASWLPRKGIRTLVAALNELFAEGLRPKVTLAGTGSSAEAIRRELPEACRSSVEIIPHVPADGLIEVYRRHRVLVLPSVIEGIPLVILEAMACGLCIVASNVGGVPDVIEDGRTGLLVPMLDASVLARTLHRILRDPRECRRMALNAHAKIQEYSWRRAAGQVERFCSARFGSATGKLTDYHPASVGEGINS